MPLSLLPLPRERAQEFEHQVRREQRRDLAGAVEYRRDFDDVAADQAQTGETAHELLRLMAGQAADLRRAGARRECRIDAVDVERHVARSGEDAANLADRPRDAARL